MRCLELVARECMLTTKNEHTIKELKGFSGSKIYLMRNDKGLFVRKMDNVDRNFVKLNELSLYFSVPKIYSYNNNILDMEYIHGLDMKSYLAVRDTKRLTEFLINILSKFQILILEFILVLLII